MHIIIKSTLKDNYIIDQSLIYKFINKWDDVTNFLEKVKENSEQVPGSSVIYNKGLAELTVKLNDYKYIYKSVEIAKKRGK